MNGGSLNLKILVPLSKSEYLDSYVKAGADEFYFGFYDDKWEDSFGIYSDINRMSGFGKLANPYHFDQMAEVTQKIKCHNKKAFVTMNANSYSQDQIRYIEKNYFPILKKIRVDGVILSDINAMLTALKHGLKPVASTMCGIYNSDIAKMYRKLGVKRMILPRDLSLDEIFDICKKIPDVEFEAFFLRNGCVFSDCYCLGMHRPECGATCTYTRYNKNYYESDYRDFENCHDTDVNDYLYRNMFRLDACAMCALYRLEQIGIKSLKIVGRADNFKGIYRDLELTRKNIRIMERSRTEEEYCRMMYMPEDYPQKCRMGFCCYYPEVRFGNII